MPTSRSIYTSVCAQRENVEIPLRLLGKRTASGKLADVNRKIFLLGKQQQQQSTLRLLNVNAQKALQVIYLGKSLVFLQGQAYSLLHKRL